MNRIAAIKTAVYFFCLIGSALLCAMELEVQKCKDYSWMQNACFVAQEMKNQYSMPHDIAGVVVQKSHLLRIDAIYKKFDSFFHFDKPNYSQCFSVYKKQMESIGIEFDREVCQDAQQYARGICRKFDVVTPQCLFFFTEHQDEILSALISSSGCFIHNQGIFRIELTSEEREKYLMLPVEFRNILRIYPRSYVETKSKL